MSCGFALRTESIAESLPVISIHSNLARDVRIAIERQADMQRVAIENSEQSNENLIRRVDEQVQSRSLRLDPLGRPIEFLLSIHWVVETNLESSLSLHAMENIGLAEDALIGFEKEKARVLTVLRERLAEQLLWRLAIGHRAATEKIESK